MGHETLTPVFFWNSLWQLGLDGVISADWLRIDDTVVIKVTL